MAGLGKAYLVACVLFVVALARCAPAAPVLPVWPPMQSVQCTEGSGVPISEKIHVTSTFKSDILSRAMSRYQTSLQALPSRRNNNGSSQDDQVATATAFLTHVTIVVSGKVSVPGAYNMALSKSQDTMTITAGEVTGALYGLESLLQLSQTGSFPCDAFTATDQPAVAHRGLVVDVASRYLQVALLHDIIDGMATLKMNALILHVSDLGAFRAQASIADATDHNNGFYSKGMIAQLIAYAADRGVTVMPGGDFPTRASGLNMIAGDDDHFAFFCKTSDSLRNDQALNSDAQTIDTVTTIIDDMNALFSTDFFFVGGSATNAAYGNCSSANVSTVFSATANAAAKYGKKAVTVGMWDQTGNPQVADLPASSVTFVVPTGTVPQASDYVLSGATQSATAAVPSLPVVGDGDSLAAYIDYTKESNNTNLIGVAATFFTEIMCDSMPCGTKSNSTPVASGFADRTQDVVVRRAVGSSLFPRISPMAGAAWFYDGTLATQVVAHLIDLHSTYLNSTGPAVCPEGCKDTCSLVSDCGKAYPNYVPDRPIFEAGFIMGTTIAVAFGLFNIGLQAMRLMGKH